MRTTNDLLNTMLASVDTHRASPVHLRRALRSIQRNEIDPTSWNEMSEMTHTIFDWMREFNKGSVSVEDQKLLDINVETITDPIERIQMARKQRKALKRARFATAKKSSKVTPELIEAVAAQLTRTTSLCAADTIWFAAALTPVLKPQELILFLDKTSKVQTSYAVTPDVAAVSKTIQQLHPLLPVADRTQFWIDYYVSTHSWDFSKIRETKGLTGAGLLGAQKKPVSRKKLTKKSLQKTTRMTASEWGTIKGRTVPEQWLSDLLLSGKTKEARYARHVLGALDVAYPYKPELDYSETLDIIEQSVQRMQRRGRKEKLENLFVLIYKTSNEFKIPEGSFYTNDAINTVNVTTITTSKALARNGKYMGNCTSSMYKSKYKRGDGVLWLLTYQGKSYNAEATKRAKGWRVRELEGRFGSRDIPAIVKNVADSLASAIA